MLDLLINKFSIIIIMCHMSKIMRKSVIPYEPPHDKSNKMICAPSEDSDQPGHPHSLIRVFAVRMKKHWALNYLLSAHSEDSDQTGRMLHWAHRSFYWFCHAAAHMRKTKTQISLRICAVLSAPLLFAAQIV